MTDHERELKEARAYHDNLREQVAKLQGRLSEASVNFRNLSAESRSLALYGGRKFTEKNECITFLEGQLRDAHQQLFIYGKHHPDCSAVPCSCGLHVALEELKTATNIKKRVVPHATPCPIHECAACGAGFVGPGASAEKIEALTKLLRAATTMAEFGDINADMEDDGIGWKQWYLDTIALIGPEASDG